MAFWVTDPELFLYSKGNDVYLWRCKRTSLVPMMPEDFDDLGKVTDHFDLVADIFEWERADYDALVAYISPRRLLVNGQGLVIAELYNFSQDGNIDQNQLVPCCYMRLLDVLNMKTYIPNLRERVIPSRTVQYLEEDGRAARVQDDASIERRAKEALEKEVSDLKAANKALEISMTKLIVYLVALARSSVANCSSWKKLEHLEAKKKTMESIIGAQIADEPHFSYGIVTLQQVLKQVKDELEQVENELEQERNKLEQERVRRLEAGRIADLEARRIAELEKYNYNHDDDEYISGYGNGV